MKCPYCGKETDQTVCPKCYAAIPEKKAATKKESVKK